MEKPKRNNETEINRNENVGIYCRLTGKTHFFFFVLYCVQIAELANCSGMSTREQTHTVSSARLIRTSKSDYILRCKFDISGSRLSFDSRFCPNEWRKITAFYV